MNTVVRCPKCEKVVTVRLESVYHGDKPICSCGNYLAVGEVEYSPATGTYYLTHGNDGSSTGVSCLLATALMIFLALLGAFSNRAWP